MVVVERVWLILGSEIRDGRKAAGEVRHVDHPRRPDHYNLRPIDRRHRRELFVFIHSRCCTEGVSLGEALAGVQGTEGELRLRGKGGEEQKETQQSYLPLRRFLFALMSVLVVAPLSTARPLSSNTLEPSLAHIVTSKLVLAVGLPVTIRPLLLTPSLLVPVKTTATQVCFPSSLSLLGTIMCRETSKPERRGRVLAWVRCRWWRRWRAAVQPQQPDG
ncbi:hypothetical protein BT69DRAFT_1292765 [Atractiella rhizophila]|nr:hypothetical protein BT69DRAFT_1292765 [Atractiella rhizophila]